MRVMHHEGENNATKRILRRGLRTRSGFVLYRLACFGFSLGYVIYLWFRHYSNKSNFINTRPCLHIHCGNIFLTRELHAFKVAHGSSLGRQRPPGERLYFPHRERRARRVVRQSW